MSPEKKYIYIYIYSTLKQGQVTKFSENQSLTFKARSLFKKFGLKSYYNYTLIVWCPLWWWQRYQNCCWLRGQGPGTLLVQLLHPSPQRASFPENSHSCNATVIMFSYDAYIFFHKYLTLVHLDFQNSRENIYENLREIGPRQILHLRVY